MSFSLSFDKYMDTLDMVPKVQSDYKRYKEFDNKKKEIQSAYKQHLADAQNADARVKALKKAVQDVFDKVMKLTGTNPASIDVAAVAISDVRELASAITMYNELALKVEKSGGTDAKTMKEFCATHKKITTFLTMCESNQFSLSSYKKALDRGQERALSDVDVAIAEMYDELREMMGLSKEDLRAHQKLVSKDKSLFTSGFHFPERLASGIKLGNATISVSAQEAEVMHDVYPEIECKQQRIVVPYIFPINSEESRKSNIYIEYDGNDVEASEQVMVAVHQLILKIVSECPLGNIVLRCSDTSANESGGFVNIYANFRKAVRNIKDSDIEKMLRNNLCESATNDVESMTKKEFQLTKFNQEQSVEGNEFDHHLYVYFEMNPEMGLSACDQLRRSFEYNRGLGCGAYGVHNIIVVNKTAIQNAKALCAKETTVYNKAEAATAWLNLLEIIKHNSDCFEYSEDGYFRLALTNAKRSVAVQLGEKYFPSLPAYDAAERKLIETIEQCNVEQGSPFIDLDDEKAFERKGDFVLGEYADGKGNLSLHGNENIAVIFADASFNPDEKSRIMSSLTLGVLTAMKPGQKRLCCMSNQHNAHVMNVMNGLEAQSDGIKYSLLENDKTQSSQQRMEYWGESIRSISKILNEKKRKSGNKKYDITDLINEDATKYLRVVYDEYTDDGQRYDNDIRTSLVPDVIKLSRETNGGVQCVLEIDSNDPNTWQKSFADSGAFDYVFVAKNHGFVDENNRRLKLSVLVDKDDAQTIAHNVLKSYIKASVTSPRYEEIGFGSFKADIGSIGSTIEIPVGSQDGTPFSMDFDSKGNGIIGYMVQGTTGSGKSSLLFSMIYNGSMKYAPDALQFYLLDFKDGTSFDEFRNDKNPIPHVKQLSIKNDMEDADAIFRNLEDEVVQRSILFKKHGAKEISEYNAMISRGRISEKYMPRLIIVIDECQNAFYSMDASGTRGLNELLVNRFEALTRVGRSYGIHFVVATQRMEARLAEKIGAQLSGRCSFKMNSVEDASALFARSVASRVNTLPRYGTMLFSNDAGKTCTQVQVAYDYGNFSQYAHEIRDVYPTNETTFEIGNEDALKIAACDMESGSYLSPKSASIRLPLAQNCMKDSSIQITFAQGQNQSLLMVGENPALASNIMVSLMYSASKLAPAAAKTTLYSYTMNSPTVNLARSILGSSVQITNDASTLLEEIYFEIEKRDEQRRTASEGEEVRFKPWLVVLDGIRKDMFEEARLASAASRGPALSTEKKSVGLNLAAAKTAAPATVNRQAPERTKIWQTITEMASDVGIFLCVYLADPRSIPSSKDYFKGYKHMITFPCQAIRDCITQRMGISIPMESSLGNKHVAFQSKLHSNAAVCYYVTDSSEVGQTEELSGGAKVYKIKPYILG